MRNKEKAATAYTEAITAVYEKGVFDGEPFDVIVNTIPAEILPNYLLDKTNAALIIDIASGPFGFDLEYAKTINEKSALLLGIPGKNASKTAGEILGEYVNHILNLEATHNEP